MISKIIAMAMTLVSIFLPTAVSAMQLKFDGLSDRLVMHLKEVHECDKLRFVSSHPADGDAWLLSFKNDTTIDVRLQRNGDVVSSLEAVSSDQTNGAFEDMMCLMIATMRALQPDSIDTYDAFYDAAFYWSRAKFHRYETAFFTDTLSVQYRPFMFRFE